MITATIYNQYKNRATNKVEWHRTVLTPVHWEDNKATNVRDSGLATADAVNVMIWFSVNAGGKTYLLPKEFAELPPELAAQHWTMTTGIDRLFRGALTDDTPLIATHDGILIKSVDTFDYGRPHMHHWEVSGT